MPPAFSSFIYYVRTLFRKTNISYPLIRTHTCASKEVKTLGFPKILLAAK